MEPTLGLPSMRSNDNFPSYGYFLVFAILLGCILALLFHSSLKKWFREFGKCFSRISSCLRICDCGSEESNERGADAEQIELNDLINGQLDIPPHQNRDNPRPHGGRQQLPFELRDFQNNLIEYRPDGGHLRDPRLPELSIEMSELQNNLINLHPNGIVSGEHRVYGLPELLVEKQDLRNKLDNLPNRDVLRNQEHSL